MLLMGIEVGVQKLHNCFHTFSEWVCAHKERLLVHTTWIYICSCCTYHKQPATQYPCHLLQKRSKCKPPPAKKQRIIVYDRDIICWRVLFQKLVKYGSNEHREYLVANKLVDKIQLQSDMSEAQIFNEIRSAFQYPMGCDDGFSFTILQQSGGGSNFDELSSSYK